MSVTLGKRKRPTHPAARETTAKTQSTLEDQDEDLSAIFRQHFEAQFEPLSPKLVKTSTPKPATQSPDSDSEDEDSDWEGLSGSEHGQNIEIIEHIAPNRTTKDRLSKEELKAFMTPKPPSTNPNPPPPRQPKQASPTDPSEAITDASNLRKDLALQRLLSESHLLHPNSTSPTLNPSGTNRHKALDMRLQTLGSRNSILRQEKMPLAHRKGIAAKKESMEEQRRREAKENGIVLEKVRKAGKKDGRMRERAVDAPVVGRFRGGTLTLSKRDVASIEGPKKRETKGKGRRRR